MAESGSQVRDNRLNMPAKNGAVKFSSRRVENSMKPFPPGSQQARLLAMLRAGPVSHLQAIVEGIGRCSDVVLKLRRRGYIIDMQMDSMVNTRGLMVHFGRYWLLREPSPADERVCGFNPAASVPGGGGFLDL